MQLQNSINQMEQLVTTLQSKQEDFENLIGVKDNELDNLTRKLKNQDQIYKQRDDIQKYLSEEQLQRTNLTEQIDLLKRETTSLRHKDEEFTLKLRSELTSLQ